ALGLLRDLDRELTEQSPVYQEAARSLLRLLLILLSREATQGMQLPHRLSPLVEEVFQIIDKRYVEPISLADVARAVGRSGSYVTNLVRAQTRLTVLEWITERRLDEARRRLRETDEDVAIVAERVGYTSVDHFIRQFRRAHAMTPGQWRKALSGTA
ncbi:MAG: helix-turn-helix transcriptional regulator, partial [Deltaproteobacteria bacterium]|nr:helix-turn-helix transcriptional regulator [Deltaproteobacteria bacterium]